jgi:hypothetical protein
MRVCISVGGLCSLMLCVVLRVRKCVNVFNLMSPVLIPVLVLHRFDPQPLRYSEAPRWFEVGRP